jgi:hypothetical protein
MSDRTRPTKHETNEPRAVIYLTIEQDKAANKTLYVATTPHVPGLRGTDPDKPHRAVNRLIAAVRDYRRPYEAKGEPVPWADGPAPDAPAPADTEVIRLTGVSPPKTIAPRNDAPKAPAPGSGAPSKTARPGGSGE